MDLIAFSESMNIHIKSQSFNKSSMMMGRKSQWEKAAIQWNDLHCVFELCKKTEGNVACEGFAFQGYPRNSQTLFWLRLKHHKCKYSEINFCATNLCS